MNIIDSYINQSHHIQKTQQLQNNLDQANGFPGSLEESLVEKGSRISHLDTKNAKLLGDKKGNLLRKSQTQAHQSDLDNLSYNDQFVSNQESGQFQPMQPNINYHRGAVENTQYGAKFGGLNEFDDREIQSNNHHILQQNNNGDEIMNQNYDTNGFFTTGPQQKIRSSQSSSQNPPHQGIQRNSNIQIDIAASNAKIKSQKKSANFNNQDSYSNQTYLGLRGQKSKSSLSLTNQTNIINNNGNVSGALSVGGGSKPLINTAQAALDTPLKSNSNNNVIVNIPSTYINQQQSLAHSQ